MTQVTNHLKRLKQKEGEGIELARAELEDTILKSEAAMGLQVAVILKSDHSDLIRHHETLALHGLSLPARNQVAVCKRYAQKLAKEDTDLAAWLDVTAVGSVAWDVRKPSFGSCLAEVLGTCSLK